MATKILPDVHDMKIYFILYCSENDKNICIFNIVVVVFLSAFYPCLVDVEFIPQRAG